MTTAQVLRQQVLDQLYQILKDPLLYGNKILLDIVNAPKDGLVPLSLVYGLTSQLKPYPLEYVSYCVPRDVDQRFRWSSDFARVGLKDNARFYETNAFGFIEEDPVDTTKYHPVQPVIFEDGKFYIDDEHHRTQGPSHVKFYEYTALDIQPIGRNKPLNDTESVCFNCDKRGHLFRDCRQPKDYTKIKKHSGRLLTHVDKDAMKAGILSQELKEALGMTWEHDEPPYYSRMRYYGYPPGYISYTISSSPRTKTPMLKVFDEEDDVIHTKDKGSQDILQPTPTYTIDYPGLYSESVNQSFESVHQSTYYTSDQTQTQEQTLQQQWNEYYYNQCQYYQQMYYTSEPPPPPPITEPPVQPSLTADTLTTHMNNNSQAINDNDSDDMDISSGDEG